MLHYINIFFSQKDKRLLSFHNGASEQISLINNYILRNHQLINALSWLLSTRLNPTVDINIYTVVFPYYAKHAKGVLYSHLVVFPPRISNH